MVRVGVQKPERYWDVVGLALVRDRDGSLKVNQVSFSAIVEHELVRLWSEALVVVHQGLDIPFGKVWMAVWWRDSGQE